MKGMTIKKRNWAFVLYPESAPDNWKDVLQKTGLPFAISPLHNKDVNPDGSIKKPHYHIILCYAGPTSFNVVNRLVSGLNQPIPQYLEQIKGYYRYFTHKDNPEKYQYKESDIECCNGFVVTDYIELTNSENLALKREILDFIIESDIYEYCDLVSVLHYEDKVDMLYCVSNNTLFFNSFLKSRRYKKAQENNVL